MPNLSDNKTTSEYWDSIHSSTTTSMPRFWSVGSQSIYRALRSQIKPGMKVLEIGCAPGKFLGWCAKYLNASVSGVDYSPEGLRAAEVVFKHLNVSGDLRCEDVFSTTFRNNSFDVVYSLGVIEHFDHPHQIVLRHLELTKPGGITLIMVPNYGGIFGRLQKYFNPDNLRLHNLEIMSPDALRNLVPKEMASDVSSYPSGRFFLGLVWFHSKWSSVASRSTNAIGHGIGLLQPFDIAPLCPFLVLRAVRTIRD